MVFLFLIPLTSSAQSVTMTWDLNDASEGVTGYNVYRMNVSGDYDKGLGQRLNAGGPLAAPPFTDNSALSRGRSFFYVVTAVNPDFESKPSNEIRVDIPFKAPSAPKNFRIGAFIAKVFLFPFRKIFT